MGPDGSVQTLIWVVFGIYVIFAHAVFKRVRQTTPRDGFLEKVIGAWVLALFEFVFVGLPGYILYRFVF